MKRISSKLGFALLLAILGLTLAPEARAFSIYVDAGGGASMMLSGSTFFPGAPALSDVGPSAAVGTFFGFANGNSPLDIQLGVQGIASYESSAATGTMYSLLGVYPTVRIQLSLLYLSFGLSPFLYTRTAGGFGFDGIGPAPSGALAYAGEVGFLYGVSPLLSMGLSVSAETVNTGTTYSPLPIANAQLFFRFYLWMHNPAAFGGAGSEQSSSTKPNSNEYKGWRYPFGKF